MNKLILDFETRSELDIKKVGAFKYAMHPSTEVMCLSVSHNGDKPRLMKGAPGPISFTYLDVRRPTKFLATADALLVAHSAHFEYAIYNYILHKRYGWPEIWDAARWSCTMARAMMCGLPASLDALGMALDLHVKKDLTGRAAMLKLCRPIGFDALGDPIYNEDPKLYDILYPYCARDVETEMLADARLPEMPPAERAIWELDLVMNHRGVQMDVELAQSAQALAAKLTAELNAQLAVLTNGEIDKATRVQSIKRWLERQGVVAEKLDKQAVNGLLNDKEIPKIVKDVISIRRQVGKSSTAKYAATIDACGGDGRVRGALQYHAAHTGRWGGRLIQPQNYPQGFDAVSQSRAVDLIVSGDADFFLLNYGDQSMQALSDTLRGTIIAAPGKKLIGADYNAIEARVLFWLADDAAALSMYARGESPYIDMAAYIYKRPITKKGNPKEYDVGKRIILGAGYGMGAERFRGTCIQYGVEIEEELALRAIRAYREKYRSVVNMWYATERAAVNAIKSPGSVYPSSGGKILWGMSRDRQFLVARLPSGRHLRYYRPSLLTVDGPHGEKEEIHYWTPGLSGAIEPAKTYGGSLVENVTQAVARDIMANGMLNCETAGYKLILTVHDELLAEIDATCTGDHIENFVALMCTLPGWAKGCPIAAEGWIGERYRK